MWIPLIALAVLVLGGTVVAAPLSSPPPVTITPPAADLPVDVAALSGIWEGAWDGWLPTRLAVEALERDSPWLVVYAWGDHPSGRSQGGSIRRRVPVFPSGTLQWEGRLSSSQEPVTFTFILTKDSEAPLWGAILPEHRGGFHRHHAEDGLRPAPVGQPAPGPRNAARSR